MEICLVCTIASSITTDFRNRKLTYRAWIPYNYSSFVTFTIAYTHQVVGIATCSVLNVACDSLFSGLLIHTYCIFEILGYRLKNIIKYGSDSAKQCARLHNHIYKFATTVNEEFKLVVFVQFLASMSMLCFDLYRLAKNEVHSQLVVVVVYTLCAFIQIFYYCWYGNEVRLKSLEIPEMIIESNWISLDNDAKKILLMIMKRATVPIEFSSVYLVSMNVNTFKSIVKSSYSAFNVLRSGQGD
ncbi:odorant receptor Or1-like [Hylaeus anthracinus]|uniref:odorant receptor Or1-like n=1 Tax=Hylaeus anthracinus TaxID=313031 RepID=UPI0023B9BE6B|nr:odorant receptor Or1-like [Hylaeus anthracinus]